MSDEDPPDDATEQDSAPPGSVKESARERVRSRFESVIPEILKRAVEIGVEKARESPADVKQFIHDLKVPKEVAHYLFQQIDDTKNGLFRVVAKEIRDFLEHTNFSGEVQKLLTTVQFEVNTTIRFTPNDGREPRKDDDDSGPKSGGEKIGDDSGEPSDGVSDRHPLPKPEVKTSVRVHRDDRDRDGREARRRRG
jgi:hypothetical protein